MNPNLKKLKILYVRKLSLLHMKDTAMNFLCLVSIPNDTMFHSLDDLQASLSRLDLMPQFEIKKSKSHMAIACDKLKYLDITSYLAAGTSLNSFYKAYDIQTPKGDICYEWINPLEKLRGTSTTIMF